MQRCALDASGANAVTLGYSAVELASPDYYARLVSELQQKATQATVSGLSQANAVLKVAQQTARDGKRLWFRRFPVDSGELMLAAAHDASFANQPGHGSGKVTWCCFACKGPTSAMSSETRFSVRVLRVLLQ